MANFYIFPSEHHNYKALHCVPAQQLRLELKSFYSVVMAIIRGDTILTQYSNLLKI